MNYQQMITYLYDLDNKKKWHFVLEPTEELLKKVGDPHKKLKIIHVTGTNGKGSVCAMMSSLLSQKYLVGMFTSPHLISFNERFQINNEEVSDNDLVHIFNLVLPHVTDQTFFEITTCMAFLLFYKKKVDYCVIEVGLGGRLDSTNVVTPIVSVITMVDYEHTDILGNTLEQISIEKGGIIKENIPVVTGASGVPLKIIKKIARGRHSKIEVVHKKVITPLLGDFQQKNAAIAVRVLQVAKIRLTRSEIKKGLLHVKIKGRLHRIGNVLLDVAHNPSAIAQLVSFLKKSEKRKIICIFGCLNDKDWKTMVARLEEVVDYFIFTEPQSKRMLDPLIIYQYIQRENVALVNRDYVGTLRNAQKMASKNDLVLVTGSFYVVGKILEILEKQGRKENISRNRVATKSI